MPTATPSDDTLISQTLLCKWRDRYAQEYIMGGYYHKMRKTKPNHRASAVAPVTKHRARLLGREVRLKNSRKSPSDIHIWRPHVAPATYLARWIWNNAVCFYSARQDLKTTRKQQPCHELVIENLKITSLTGNEHVMIEEAKRFSLNSWNPLY